MYFKKALMIAILWFIVVLPQCRSSCSHETKSFKFFTGFNGAVNIACASGLSFPVEYIKKLGKEASDEQRARLNRRQSLTLLDDLEEIESPVIPDNKPVSKRKRTSLELLEGLDWEVTNNYE